MPSCEVIFCRYSTAVFVNQVQEQSYYTTKTNDDQDTAVRIMSAGMTPFSIDLLESQRERRSLSNGALVNPAKENHSRKAQIPQAIP